MFLHPFAEEMNKSRRMAALQSRALALAGYGVLQIDLLGCGDSSGGFSDATWDGWIEDAVLAWRWLRARVEGPLWLWGLRVGCLLATAAAMRVGERSRLLLWQPVTSGKQALQQFLRLSVAGELMSGKDEGGAGALKARLAAGTTVEVAGYRLAPSLAGGLEQAELTYSALVEQLAWLELSTRDERMGMRGQLDWRNGAHGDLEGCPNLLCSARPVLRGVDKGGALREPDGHVPSVVAVVHALHRRGQDPGWGK